MDIKKLIKLQNAIIRAHQKIKDVQNDNNNQTKTLKSEFDKEINSLNKTLEQLNKELSSFTKKEETDNQNKELELLKKTLDEVNKSLDRKINSIQLTPGKDGKDGLNGMPGKDGKPGRDGRDGKDGINGKDGANGLSAYEIAVKQGFEGTEEEWINRITNSGGKSYTRQLTAINERINKLSEVPETVYATGADFGEFFEWYDGNPNNEDRTGYFVTLHEDTGKIKIANSEDDILGITTDSEAFIGNYGKDKTNNPKYSIVGLIGVVSVRECKNIKCSVGGYCMPNDLGLASGTDKLGYQVVKRVNDNYVQVMLNCGSDMIHRLNNKSGGTELTGGDNTVIENNEINVYTNTGYIVSDKDIQLQTITDSGTTGTNKIIYIEDKEIMVIWDSSNKVRRSENGIDFEVITLPYACKSMFYNPISKRMYGLANGYFLYSDDNGKTWEAKQSTNTNNINYITRGQPHVDGFIGIDKNAKTIYNFDSGFRQTGYIKSAISPDFVTQFSEYQFIWCNNTGTFKYGVGSNEGNFASLTNVTINMLKTINSKQIVGLKNNNKIYIIKNPSGITGNEWIPYTLPDTCTVYDIIFNPYDETYYIFTDINTYYKTKDFVTFDSIEKNDNLRGIQGYFTLMGIQMTTSNHNGLLLCPTRTKVENMLQHLKRATDKKRWVGPGLEQVGEEQIGIKEGDDYISVSDGGLFLTRVDERVLTSDVVESIYVSIAELKDNFDPYEMESWFWEFGFPSETDFKATKLVFNQEGSFYNQATWEEEYTVEQYEYGYVCADSTGSLFKYVKLGNLSWFFNKGE